MEAGKTFKNGQKVSEQEGDVLICFFKIGIVKAQGKLVDDAMQGEWIFYRESGNLWQVGHFLNGKKHGSWVRYDKAGKLEYKAEFDHG